jgi:hypothetical protein
MLYNVLNPRGPRYVAIPCNVAGIIAIVLLVIDPDANLPALWLLIPMAVTLYGTALVMHLRRLSERWPARQLGQPLSALATPRALR